jgi:hypothetical protein
MSKLQKLGIYTASLGLGISLVAGGFASQNKLFHNQVNVNRGRIEVEETDGFFGYTSFTRSYIGENSPYTSIRDEVKVNSPLSLDWIIIDGGGEYVNDGKADQITIRGIGKGKVKGTLNREDHYEVFPEIFDKADLTLEETGNRFSKYLIDE